MIREGKNSIQNVKEFGVEKSRNSRLAGYHQESKELKDWQFGMRID
ncbi:MAG TPA: hypothetical protein VGS15_01080 [Candidatus Acidoferrales bacterium]|nr:hypothetical protein [Candidatus Acidoferrales bacterium]